MSTNAVANEKQKAPPGLDSSLFVTKPILVTTTTSANKFCTLSKALKMWSEQSRELGYAAEAECIQHMCADVCAANAILETKSERANQISRDVCRKSLSKEAVQQLTPLLFCGCCFEIYQRLLHMHHGLRCMPSPDSSSSSSNMDFFHLTHIISFLDSDREFKRVVQAHQTIEDAYKVLNILVPRLRQVHAAGRLGEILQKDDTLCLPEAEMPHYHNYPCGSCSFQYIMMPP
jgi:hypothetical protein